MERIVRDTEYTDLKIIERDDCIDLRIEEEILVTRKTSPRRAARTRYTNMLQKEEGLYNIENNMDSFRNHYQVVSQITPIPAIEYSPPTANLNNINMLTKVPTLSAIPNKENMLTKVPTVSAIPNKENMLARIQTVSANPNNEKMLAKIQTVSGRTSDTIAKIHGMDSLKVYKPESKVLTNKEIKQLFLAKPRASQLRITQGSKVSSEPGLLQSQVRIHTCKKAYAVPFVTKKAIVESPTPTCKHRDGERDSEQDLPYYYKTCAVLIGFLSAVCLILLFKLFVYDTNVLQLLFKPKKEPEWLVTSFIKYIGSTFINALTNLVDTLKKLMYAPYYSTTESYHPYSPWRLIYFW